MTTTEDVPTWVEVTDAASRAHTRDAPARVRTRRVAPARWAWARAVWDSLSAFLLRARQHRRTVRTRTPAETAAPDVRHDDMWTQGPASLADLYAYTMSGAWAPGQRHWAVEFAGRVYGFTALGASAVLYVIAWVIQRPGRLFAAVVLSVVIRWTSGWST